MDICRGYDTVGYGMSTEADLADTVKAVESRDISNAVLFLASDEAHYVTGLEFTVDAGNTIR